MSICGNFVELVEHHRVKNDEDFIIWDDTNLTDYSREDDAIYVYIEKKILEELSHKQLIIIDAAMGDLNGQEVGMLFIKPDQNKYGI